MVGIFLVLLSGAIQFAILARLLTRIGWNPAWGLVVILPAGWLVMLWFIAFGRWPIPDSREIGAHPEVVEAFE